MSGGVAVAATAALRRRRQKQPQQQEQEQDQQRDATSPMSSPLPTSSTEEKKDEAGVVGVGGKGDGEGCVIGSYRTLDSRRRESEGLPHKSLESESESDDDDDDDDAYADVAAPTVGFRRCSTTTSLSKASHLALTRRRSTHASVDAAIAYEGCGGDGEDGDGDGDGDEANTRAATSRLPNGIDSGDRSRGSGGGGGGGSLGLLVLCAAGVCVCYLCYGLVQERVMSRDSVAMAEAGPMSSFLVLSQTITNSAVAFVWTYVDSWLRGGNGGGGRTESGSRRGGVRVGGARWSELNHPLLFLTSFCYFSAMASSNEALRWVSYPAAVLAKSSKLIPTMAMGLIVEKRSYSKREWVGACLITSGIVAFNLSRMSVEGSAGGGGAGVATASSSSGRTMKESPYGLFLLFFSLAMDGLLASCQGMLKRDTYSNGGKRTTKCRPPSAIETMLFVNLYACFLLLPASIWSGHFGNGISLLLSAAKSDAEMTGAATTTKWIALLNMTAAGGQVFIFLTIYFFSPLMCTTITTTRKFFTILLSVRQFGHVFSTVQWTSIAMVFAGLYMEIAAKLNNRAKVLPMPEAKKGLNAKIQ